MKRHFDWNNIGEVLEKFAAILGVLAFFSVPYFFSHDSLLLVYQLYLCAINTGLIAYLAYVHRHKYRRYITIGDYLHFVNHNVRDWLYLLKKRTEAKALRDDDFGPDFRRNTVAMLDQIANAFSQLTGVRCSVCIKELRPQRKLKVVYRDALSDQTRSVRPEPEPHPLERDTPCCALYETSIRHYGCNDVVKAWDDENFDSPSFDLHATKPKLTRLMGLRFVWQWPLKFRSCLVVPIRYTNCTNPPLANGKGEWNYWGFLCIDSNHRNVFDYERMWPLAAAFADVIYIYLSSTYDTMEEITRPSTKHELSSKKANAS